MDFAAYSLNELRGIVERDLPPTASARHLAEWPHFLLAVCGVFKLSYSFTLPELRLLVAPLWARAPTLSPCANQRPRPTCLTDRVALGSRRSLNPLAVSYPPRLHTQQW